MHKPAHMAFRLLAPGPKSPVSQPQHLWLCSLLCSDDVQIASVAASQRSTMPYRWFNLRLHDTDISFCDHLDHLGSCCSCSLVAVPRVSKSRTAVEQATPRCSDLRSDVFASTTRQQPARTASTHSGRDLRPLRRF
nr:hypothetical protein CFP56_10099 [Quercus suber]